MYFYDIKNEVKRDTSLTRFVVGVEVLECLRKQLLHSLDLTGMEAR